MSEPVGETEPLRCQERHVDMGNILNSSSPYFFLKEYLLREDRIITLNDTNISI